ncbi:MAG TPA: hypothetical protein DEF39_12775 [Hungateiclostridium thermocellum]|jgi:hypothetical protein|uniref:Uncharacterized protein n=2 Tax=Acetivibrio thermocellus TaxID=1515 RepID=A3DF68_ACET2|nr:hypothetical protein [Acetivibrio thermocellus]ABN52597.1 hypothetical protein Cthe_1365 [Acetivibrio thermocellus ATCC 27405]ADU73956.1 hypothetical protein Clo1313_0888 [Acetivibrio thermocellus DSM 1313]ALX07894.1 hypothetical protein AD2_00899 [Acetivibrio thermocellus AD2]ANV75640.1 hypothetical protein LQRI_0899 [Acetivibrio thermocellus DSM 2360]EIC06091.1 hypothetical protein YSBL_0217 [Acetivibrio thermocellus YS]
MKKGIVIILVILLTIGAGFIIPIMINKDVGGANNPSVNVTYTPGGTKEPLSTQKSDKSPGMSFESTPTPIDSTSPDSILHEDLQNNTAGNGGKKSQASGNKKPVKGSQEWIEKKIQEHRDEILDEDLADFRRIFPKVDINYVQSLGKDGYTDEETEELKRYLYKTLGEADYERAKILFYRYSYILEED